MYLSCTDTEITKRQAATGKRCRDMIAEYRRKPWWRKIGRETEVRGMIIAEWSAFSKWMDDRIAFMRKPNASVSSSGDEPGYAPGTCSAFWLTGYQRLWAKLVDANRPMRLWRKLRRVENRYQKANGFGQYSQQNAALEPARKEG